MDANTIILLVEALAITLLSVYLWSSIQNHQEVETLDWVLLFVLTLFLIGFAVTMSFNPMVL